MAECGPRKKKYKRFQVGAFMAMHKQKREEAVRQSEKIIAENLKIAKQEKELKAKRQKLERLETKVIFDCVIGKLRVRRNYYNHKNDNLLDCDWFKKLLFFHLCTCQVVIGRFVIGHFVIGQFNRPITFEVVV